jgi:hypothetical protein
MLRHVHRRYAKYGPKARGDPSKTQSHSGATRMSLTPQFIDLFPHTQYRESVVTAKQKETKLKTIMKTQVLGSTIARVY